MMGKYIYIAGPITGEPVRGTARAILAGNKLAKLGHYPYVPHLNLLWQLVTPHDVDFWYDFDLRWLFKCDCLLRLSGKSYGADKEVEFAQQHGIPVFYKMSELLKWLEEN